MHWISCQRSIGLLLSALLLLSGCSESDRADDNTQPVKADVVPRIIPAQDALSGAHIPTLDPATMNQAEIRKALGGNAQCTFRYTSDGKPVLALTSLQNGAIKLNGKLVKLAPSSDQQGAQDDLLLLLAEPIRMTVTPDPASVAAADGDKHAEATVVFEAEEQLKVGYRGYLDCNPIHDGVAARG